MSSLLISYVLPTRDRPRTLRATLDALGRLPPERCRAAGGAEVIVVDNASAVPTTAPAVLENALPVRVARRDRNEGAAARNHGAGIARGDWIVMLDDDSFPLDDGHVEMLRSVPDDVAAIGAEILLPGGDHEAGGLPEVFVGCGVALRREVFLGAGGYDPAFDYYAEEYDLCARLIRDGWRIVHDRRFRVRHDKIADGRDMDRILALLVRNNGWVAQRYAPADARDAALREVRERYREIAARESALAGYERGAEELDRSLADQPRQPLQEDRHDRFTGLAHVRRALDAAGIGAGTRAMVVDEGKNAWAVRQAMAERSVEVTDSIGAADIIVIGTLSPGPMLDARSRWREAARPVIAPWCWESDHIDRPPAQAGTPCETLR